jgi:hypothetical protein
MSISSFERVSKVIGRERSSETNEADYLLEDAPKNLEKEQVDNEYELIKKKLFPHYYYLPLPACSLFDELTSICFVN